MTTARIDPPPSPKLRPWHLDRAAIGYIRQSTPQQVLEHQESTARQYALGDRAIALGWPPSQVQVIDDDLGKSGQSIEGRRSEEHTSELQSRPHLVCRLLLEKKKKTNYNRIRMTKTKKTII